MAVNNSLGQSCSHRVRIHIREIHRPKVNLESAIKNAERLYGGAGVHFAVASAMCIHTTAAEYAKLNVVDGDCKWNQESPEQTELHALAGGTGSQDVLVFFVKGIKTLSGATLNGCAGHAPARPAAVLGENCTPWTLAHEVGHVLLGPTFSPVHTSDRGNIMFRQSSTFSLTSTPSFTAAQAVQNKTGRYVVAV